MPIDFVSLVGSCVRLCGSAIEMHYVRKVIALDTS